MASVAGVHAPAFVERGCGRPLTGSARAGVAGVVAEHAKAIDSSPTPISEDTGEPIPAADAAKAIDSSPTPIARCCGGRGIVRPTGLLQRRRRNAYGLAAHGLIRDQGERSAPRRRNGRFLRSPLTWAVWTGIRRATEAARRTRTARAWQPAATGPGVQNPGTALSDRAGVVGCECLLGDPTCPRQACRWLMGRRRAENERPRQASGA